MAASSRLINWRHFKRFRDNQTSVHHPSYVAKRSTCKKNSFTAGTDMGGV